MAQTEKRKENEVLVVITYLAKEAQGRELEFAIAGWRRHFKGSPFRIVITGENLPHIEGDDITLVESKRVEAREGQYRAHLDYVSCLKKVRAAFPDSKGFILVADDCYAVNDFTLDDVKELKCLHGEVDFDPQSPNAWRRDKMKTKMLLLRLGYPQRNWTTHLPIWYEWGKIMTMWLNFNMDNESYVIEDLYHNFYFPVSRAVTIGEDDNYKCGVYTTNPNIERLERAFTEKIWITNSPDGYVPELVTMLENYYHI